MNNAVLIALVAERRAGADRDVETACHGSILFAVETVARIGEIQITAADEMRGISREHKCIRAGTQIHRDGAGAGEVVSNGCGSVGIHSKG